MCLKVAMIVEPFLQSVIHMVDRHFILQKLWWCCKLGPSQALQSSLCRTLCSLGCSVLDTSMVLLTGQFKSFLPGAVVADIAYLPARWWPWNKISQGCITWELLLKARGKGLCEDVCERYLPCVGLFKVQVNPHANTSFTVYFQKNSYTQDSSYDSPHFELECELLTKQRHIVSLTLTI